MDADAPSLAALLGTFAINAGLAWMTGCVALHAWCRSRPGTWPRSIDRRLARWLGLASVWTALALAFDLWRRSAEAAAVPLRAAGAATTTMLTATHYGHAWMFCMAAVLALAATARLAGRLGDPRMGTVGAAVVGIGVLVYARSIVSHAGGEGDLSFGVAIDGIHLAMVSLWAGVVWVSAGVMLGPVDDERWADATPWLRALSSLATVALTAIVLTGLVNSWRATAGSFSALWGSTYGMTLAAKAALVAGAAGLGGLNRWVFLPRMLAPDHPRTPVARRAFLTVLCIEGGVLAFVMLLAAALGNLEPPGSM